MRLFFLLTLTLAVSARADILPDEVYTCQGKAAGSACTTPDGKEGTCQEQLVSRLDYSQGIPPGIKQVKMLGCQAKASAQARALPSAWLGLGLAFLAVVAAVATRKPRQPVPA